MNWDMLGHEWAVDLLQSQIRTDNFRHAYLFVGPEGVGRRTLALRFAQALNCTDAPTKGEFCGECRVCTQIASMRFADLDVVAPEPPSKGIKVEQIRLLQKRLALSAYEARYRVALLFNFEETTISGMNALLKTLEEPAGNVVLIVIAESAERLLPTIVSRCEVLRLRPSTLESLSKCLETRFNLPEEQAQLVAHLSAGRPGDALNLFKDPERQELRTTCLDDHWRMLSSNRVERFAYAEIVARDKEDLSRILSLWISLWRDVGLRTVGNNSHLVNLDYLEQIDKLAERVGTERSFQILTSLVRTKDLLARNVNPRLAIENVMLILPHR